jgi:hypothetical protein
MGPRPGQLVNLVSASGDEVVTTGDRIIDRRLRRNVAGRWGGSGSRQATRSPTSQPFPRLPRTYPDARGQSSSPPSDTNSPRLLHPDFAEGDVEWWSAGDGDLDVVGVDRDGFDELLDAFAALGLLRFLPEHVDVQVSEQGGDFLEARRVRPIG